MIGAYLIGEPGAGKSALMGAVTRSVPTVWERSPFAHALYLDPTAAYVPAGAQIGGHHPEFPGTDRLSMAVQPLATLWLGALDLEVVVAEGDRLANESFLDAMEAVCEHFDLVVLDTPAEVAAERRAARGSAQNETWLKGRRTKVARLARRPGAIRLDGRPPLIDLVDQAVRAIPAFAAIRTLAE